MLVHNLLEVTADRLPRKVALIDGKVRLTYDQVNSSANRFAAMLMLVGVEKQSRVVILLDNSSEAVISIYGILKAGCIFVLVNGAIKSRKLAYILNDSKAEVLITHVSKNKIVHEALEKAHTIKNIIWCGKDLKEEIYNQEITRKRIIKNIDWKNLSDASLNYSKAALHKTIDLDIATIIYTSGSTGEPKGVVSAHYNITAVCKSIIQYLQNSEDDIILNLLPFSFDYGLYQVLMTFFFGGTIVIEKSFNYPYRIIERLEQEKVTGFPIVPTIVALLSQIENIDLLDLSYVRYVTSTSSALPKPYIKQLQSLFPEAKIYSMYGQTECKRVSYLPPEYIDKKPESVGIPIPNEEVFILDDSGHEVGSGEIGELVVRGLNVMQGYWNAPDETRKKFRNGRYSSDIFLYTGDLFKKDSDGFLYYISRKDDMIKVKDYRVSPKEIESVIYEIVGVNEVSVISVPDSICGNLIKAYIVTKKNCFLTKNDIFDYCKKNLESYMVPKYIEFINSLPKTENGKINKDEL